MKENRKEGRKEGMNTVNKRTNECPHAVVAEWILDNIETNNKCKNITTQVCPKKFGPQTHGFPTKTKTPTILSHFLNIFPNYLWCPTFWVMSRSKDGKKLTCTNPQTDDQAQALRVSSIMGHYITNPNNALPHGKPQNHHAFALLYPQKWVI